MPAATSRFLLLPPFRCRHLRRHPFGCPLHPPRRMRHRRQTAGALGAFASVPSRPLRGLCLRPLRSFADDAPQSLRSRVCQPVVRNGEAGNGYTPFAALCGRTDQQNAGVEPTIINSPNTQSTVLCQIKKKPNSSRYLAAKWPAKYSPIMIPVRLSAP